ncbi:MAG: TonB-dependent receptor [Calditrichaeota bacterium]|nr:TonB-dependent receptor [Calditrichota bacterium]
MNSIKRFPFLVYLLLVVIPWFCIAQCLNSEMDLSLEALLDMPVSSASKYKQTSREAPASITIVTAEEIEKFGYRTLGEILNSIRGFYLTNDRIYSSAGVRGFDLPSDFNNRVLLLINGHTVNDIIYGSAYFGTEFGFDIGSIDRIEIVRGPGSFVYGNNAMFGVINVITKNGNNLNGLKVSAETGSFGRLQSNAQFGKEFANGLDLFVSGIWGDVKGQDLYFKEYDDSLTNYGKAENVNWDKYYGSFIALSYKNLYLTGMLSSREKGIPTGAWEMNFNDDRAISIDERSFLELKYETNCRSDKCILLRGYIDHYKYWGSYPYDVMWYDASDGYWLGGEVRFLWDISHFNRFITGFEYQDIFKADYRAWDTEQVYFDENFPFRVFSVFAQNELQIMSDLSLTLGLRYDEYSAVKSTITPRAAIVYHPNNLTTLKLLYGEAFRAPNIYEMYFEDEGISKANPNLKPEMSKTIELSCYRQITKSIFGRISVFQTQLHDLINQVVDPSDDLLQFRNFTKVTARGIELEGNRQLTKEIRGAINYCFQESYNEDESKELTNSPNHVGKIKVAIDVLKPLYVAYEIHYESGRKTIHGTSTDPFLFFNLNLNFQPRDYLTLSMHTKNLFNTTYELPGGFELTQDAIQQDGRRFIFKAVFEY